MQNSFEDVDTQEKELIDIIADRDSKKTYYGYNKKFVVEHSYIDFQMLILGRKLKWDTDNGKYVFDSQKLARSLIQNDLANIDFYSQEAIQKLIDYQFETTYKFFMAQTIIYIVGFVIPLGFIIFHEHNLRLMNAMYVIGFFTQLLFFGLEMIKMYKHGFKNYFKFFNVIDLSSFINYLMQM